MMRIVVVLIATTFFQSDAGRVLRLQKVLSHDEESNPLLERTELPRFADIKISEHAEPAVMKRLEEGRGRLQNLEKFCSAELAKGKTVAYNDLMPPLEELYEDVGGPMGSLSHLKSVKDSAELREIIMKLEPKMITFYQQLSQSKPLYDAFVKLKADASFAKLSTAQKRIVNKELNDRRLSGVGLSGEKAKEFNELQQRQSELRTNYSNNVMDATGAWNATITDKNRVKGIPERTLAMAAQKAQVQYPKATAADGPWTFTVDYVMVFPVLKFAEDRALRETMFHALATLASTGKHNNEPVIMSILASRQRSAELLNYDSYADVSFASKMATRPQVHSLLDELQSSAKPAAKKDLEELEAFAKKKDNLSELKKWDNVFYAEQMQKEKFGIDEEELRKYFALPTVLDGLFALSLQMFDAKVTPADSDAPRTAWDKEVKIFKVSSGDGKDVKGYMVLDLYARPGEKRAGAWANPMTTRRHLPGDKKLQRPVATISTNFPAPQKDTPSLVSLSEIHTLFHEFGHAIQHVLTRQNETAVSGLNGIEWDAVEISSQFMEYFISYDKDTLYSFAKHYKTGEPLPEKTYQSIKDSLNFREGTQMSMSIFLSKIDLRLHEKFEKDENINDIYMSLATDVLPSPPLSEDRKLCSFQHIFAGGYAAGYYSYIWSEVLSADAFSAFEEENDGLRNKQKMQTTGHRYRDTFLSEGGGEEPAQVFKDFRGRAPSSKALLHYSNLETSFLFF